jgi:hypothetical protein
MLVEYAESEEAHSPYPPRSDVAENYATYVGETYYTWATVVESNDETFTAEQGDLNLIVPQQTEGASNGDVVQVYGVLQPDNRVDPTSVVVSEAQSRVYMFGVSGLAAFITIGVFFRRIQIDIPTASFQPRDGKDQ